MQIKKTVEMTKKKNVNKKKILVFMMGNDRTPWKEKDDVTG